MSLLLIAFLVLAPCIIYIGIVFSYKYDSPRHWSSIPGFCMGIGIAVTFVTMYLTFQNKEKVADIASLIPEISKAFIGSLAGLGLSLVMTYWIKSRISAIEDEEQKKAGENNNPYKLLQQIVENTSANTNAIYDLKRTTEPLLSENNRHLLDMIQGNNNAKSSIDSLKSELIRLFDINNDEVKQSRKTLKEFTDKTEQFNTNLFNELIQKLEKAVRDMSNEAIGKSLGNLEKINADLSNNLENIFGKTGNTIAQGQTDLKKSVDDLKGVLENKIDAINKETTANASLAKNAVTEILEEIQKQVADMGSSIATQADAVIAKKEESINNTFNTIDEKQQAAVQIQGKIVDNMKSIFVDMQKAFNDKIDEINTATGKIQGEIIGMGDNITAKADEVVSEKIKSLEKTFERIEDYQGRSQTTLDTATHSFKETVEKYEQVNEDKTELIRIIGQQLKELEAVRKNGSTLIQNWEQIAQSMKNMQDRINQINGVITQLDGIKTVLANQQNLNNDVQ